MRLASLAMCLLILKVGDLAVLSIPSVSTLEQGCCHSQYIVHDSRHLGNTEIDIIFKESLLINNEAALLIGAYNFCKYTIQQIDIRWCFSTFYNKVNSGAFLL